MRILVAEDDNVSRRLLCVTLGKWGYEAITVADGQAAWQIEHANAPKQRSGSMTAIVFGAFLRGPDIILVHIDRNYS